MKIDRLLSIVIVLLDRDLVSAGELSQRFEVSVRTIQRDIETLCLAGIPIFSQAGKLGGYAIVPGYKINNRLLSGDDFLNLLTALKSIQGTFSDKRFLGSLEKIYGLLPPHSMEGLVQRENSLVIDFSLGKNDTVLAEKLKIIETAIEGTSLVKCTYSSHKLESIDRLVEPMTLVLQWGSWYLFCFCLVRNDFRLFKISRMHDVVVTEEKFVRRSKKYDEFFAERPNFNNERVVELVFIAKPTEKAVIEEHHSSNEIEYQHDGTIVVRSRQPEEERMYRYLLSYGDSIKIVEPSHVAKQVRELARKVADTEP